MKRCSIPLPMMQPDALLCGGVPPGSFLVSEDSAGRGPSDVFAKCFLSYGFNSSDHLVVSGDVPNWELPSCKTKQPEIDDLPKQSSAADTEFHIAWRYSRKANATSTEARIAYDFDKLFKLAEQKQTSFSTINLAEPDTVETLKRVLESQIRDTKQENTLTRICMAYPETEDCNHQEMLKFLFKLKSLVRSYEAILLLTVPVYLDTFVRNYILMISDYYIKFEQFQATSVESANDALLKEYNGSVEFRKVWNHDGFKMPYKLIDLVYKFKRKNLVVEKGCLLPDLSETASRNERRPELASKLKKHADLF
ncbi:uncharacterized protein LOC134844277 isoform X2 [Symsagittifera roscoffensis]|uniref:uncharacterized protein LOC134844277 isoform X2 n=1 Tax=Symsagittifera roscoffensis TaxID=84072 RepID=UPI00307CB5C7